MSQGATYCSEGVGGLMSCDGEDGNAQGAAYYSEGVSGFDVL